MGLDYALVAIAGIVLIVGAAAFSSKLGVAAPLLLVLIGIGYSFIPGVPAIEVEPDVILMGVLPLILYAAAIQLPVVDFRRNFGTISALSVVLVVVSALITGFVLFMLLPDLDLATAIALGAVISPPDVVAATAIGKRLGLPPRLLAILEGEGLVNDATALVLMRTAIAAAALTASGAFDIWGAVGDFGYAVVVAAGIGLVVGVVAVFVRRKLNQPILDTAISFAVPFIAYLPAEELHASGVISVVVAGIYSGHQSARLSPQSRVAERLNWRTLQFVLENGVFLLMGAQLAGIVAEIEAEALPWHQAVALGVLSAAILMTVRFGFVWPLLFVVRRGERINAERAAAHDAALERVKALQVTGDTPMERRIRRVLRRSEQARNDIAALRTEGLGWRGGVVLGWAGMRGVVTLAAAQSLPKETPYYEQLVLIAFTVAIVTLLVQGGTLPFVIRATGIRGTDSAADHRALATLLDEMQEAGLATLETPDLPGGVPVDPDVLARVRLDTSLAAAAAWERAEHTDGETLADAPHQQYRELRRRVLDAERATLLEARAQGAYPSRILQRAQTLLDLEDARLSQIDASGDH
jgi:NhaP-type Na+/H+ and K+/H+ antiporters